MSRVTQDDVAEAVVTVVASVIGGAIALGGSIIGGVLERRRQEELVDREVARLLLEDYLNRRPGAILGDSATSFRYEDPVSPIDNDEDEDERFLNQLFSRL